MLFQPLQSPRTELEQRDAWDACVLHTVQVNGCKHREIRWSLKLSEYWRKVLRAVLAGSVLVAVVSKIAPLIMM